MNTGKECSSAECARLRSRLDCVTTRRVASTRQGVRSAPQFDFRHRPASCAAPRAPLPRRHSALECADMSALWSDATCRVEESGDMSPHSKSDVVPSHSMSVAPFQSARGLAHSKTLRVGRAAPNFRQVLDCGGPPPLFPGCSAQFVFIHAHPWLKMPISGWFWPKSFISTAFPDLRMFFPMSEKSFPVSETSFPTSEIKFPVCRARFPVRPTSSDARRTMFPVRRTLSDVCPATFPVRRTLWNACCTSLTERRAWSDRCSAPSDAWRVSSDTWETSPASG